jgi:3-oxoacyl-[acyl-carrier protein] reductase
MAISGSTAQRRERFRDLPSSSFSVLGVLAGVIPLARKTHSKEAKKMEGNVVIITGAAKGIGRYAAHTLAAAGARVVLADIDMERLDKTFREIREIDARAAALPVDVRNESDVRRLVHEVIQRFGRIDTLINDAGIVPHFNWGIPRWPRIRFLDKEFWDGVIQTNLGGTFLCTKHVVPFMEERRTGHIINLWGGGKPQNHGACAYVVSKDAIRTFTRFVAEEERDWNICVVALSPRQAIATEDAPEEAKKRLPSPNVLGNAFVLAAQTGMELNGYTLEYLNERLVVVE